MELIDGYIWKENQKLRCGYTTGSCAAAAAKACMTHLLTGKPVDRVELMTPKGVRLDLKVEEASWDATAPKMAVVDQVAADPVFLHDTYSASCAIRKDGGDDFDMTHGLMIFADVELVGVIPSPEETGKGKTAQRELIDLAGKVERSGPIAAAGKAEGSEDRDSRMISVEIDGGEGVGRVTKKGLDQPVGNAAINSTPRRMITEAVRQVAEAHHYTGSVRVTIRVPGGEQVAEKTFNPRLGILGGISILGTSGIVVPMSEEALVDTIRAEIRQKLADDRTSLTDDRKPLTDGRKLLVLTPGNYGETFAGKQYGISPDRIVLCSNFIGKALDMAAEEGAEEILLIGHIGKLIKLSGGIMNTHSREADSRLEILVAHALRCGCSCSAELARKLLDCNTTEDALELLGTADFSQAVVEAEASAKQQSSVKAEASVKAHAAFLYQVCDQVREKAEYYAAKRLRDAIHPAVILFSQEQGLLSVSERGERLAEILKGDSGEKKSCKHLG